MFREIAIGIILGGGVALLLAIGLWFFFTMVERTFSAKHSDHRDEIDP